MNNLDLNLKDTFDFIHNILFIQNGDWDEIDDSTFSQYHEPVLEAYHYYTYNAEPRQHTCSLLLLNDKIEFVACSEEEDNFYTLQSETE